MARLCRSCCGSMPFGLGGDAHSRSSGSTSSSSSSGSTVSRRKKKKGKGGEDESTSEESWDSNESQDLEAVKADAPPDFRPPGEAQVQVLVKSWISRVQQRAAKIWTRDQVVGMLETIARSVNYTEDPILGDMSPSAPCVEWHGDVSKDQGYPVLSIQKPSNPDATSTYLCRVLAFLFADDASLRLLKQVGGGPGAEMNCGNPKCARLSHLVGYNSKWAQRFTPDKAAPAGAKQAVPKGKGGPPKAKYPGKAKAMPKAKPKGAPPPPR